MKWLLVMALTWIIVACGEYSSEQPAPADDPAFAQVKPVIARACGRCHNGSEEPAFTSAAVFKGSTAKARLVSGTMPPGGRIDPADKSALLSYLGGG